jgi:hypothetical protein
LNASAKEIVLDKILVAGFSLRLKAEILEKDGTLGEMEAIAGETKALEKPGPEAAGTRFVSVKPGDSLSRNYDLAGPIRYVVQGHETDRNHIHHGFYGEVTGKFSVPSGARKLIVEAWYERGFWRMAHDQFEEWFGRSGAKIGLWTGRARSNRLVLKAGRP